MDRVLNNALNICKNFSITEAEARAALKGDWPYYLPPTHKTTVCLADVRGMGPKSLKILRMHLVDEIPLRVDWDTYGLELAKTVALRADCTRRKVGAVLMMPDHSIAGTGYNGGYSGGPSCLKGECPRGQLTTEQLAPNSDYSSGQGTCIALHAEWNVLLRASWEQMKDSTLYVTDKPCHLCSILIRGTHIKKVVWPTGIRYSMVK